jgi:hypothetical protein
MLNLLGLLYEFREVDLATGGQMAAERASYTFYRRGIIQLFAIKSSQSVGWSFKALAMRFCAGASFDA